MFPWNCKNTMTRQFSIILEKICYMDYSKDSRSKTSQFIINDGAINVILFCDVFATSCFYNIFDAHSIYHKVELATSFFIFVAFAFIVIFFWWSNKKNEKEHFCTKASHKSFFFISVTSNDQKFNNVGHTIQARSRLQFNDQSENQWWFWRIVKPKGQPRHSVAFFLFCVSLVSF